MATENQKATGCRTIQASEFKAKCLKLMDEVAESGEEIVITKNGRPLLRLAPYRVKPQAPFGRDQGKIRVLGDMTAPIDVEWEVSDKSGPSRKPLGQWLVENMPRGTNFEIPSRRDPGRAIPFVIPSEE